MSCLTTPCYESQTLKPHEHVCYSHGLVLGVDEFVQEELYFLEKAKEHNRALHGYGTISGLKVNNEIDQGRPKLRVEPGLAIDLTGNVVRVPGAQCAWLDEWLERNADSLASPEPDPNGDHLELWLNLCYRSCKTREVPIPSGPCRSVENSKAFTRVADDFHLDLKLNPPDQREVDTVRAFGDLLRNFELSDAEPSSISQEDLEDLVRALAEQTSPAPALSPAPRIAAEDASEYLDAAFRVWVTEVRPKLHAPKDDAPTDEAQKCCILLARLDVPIVRVAGNWQVDGSPSEIVIDESTRPYLLHTQLLQEFLLSGAPMADLGTDDHGRLVGLEDDDHMQYLKVVDRESPAVQDELLRDLSGANTHRVVGLPQSNNAGEAMPHGQTAGGDLSGSYPNPTIAKLQAKTLSAAAPQDRQILRFSAGAAEWQLSDLVPDNAAGGDLSGNYPDPEVVGLRGRELSNQVPSDGQWLRFTGGKWTPTTLSIPNPETNAEPQLTRIIASSWAHSALQVPQRALIDLDEDPERPALVVAFGLDVGRLSDPPSTGVKVQPGSLDEDSFQVFFDELAPPLAQRHRIMPAAVVPVEVRLDGADPTRVVAARLTRSTVAHGVAFVLDPKAAAMVTQKDRVDFVVVLHGAHCRDTKDRAIDAEFVRSQFPTGDRPAGARVGVQGGDFRSWFHWRRLTRIPFEDLVNLRITGLNRTVARRIVARVGRGITDFEELRGVTGVTDAMIAALRDRLMI